MIYPQASFARHDLVVGRHYIWCYVSFSHYAFVQPMRSLNISSMLASHQPGSLFIDKTKMNGDCISHATFKSNWYALGD